ncbi:PaaI family thioesterase [Alcaligenaceae bacterium B3P038]|nr:PaaI family thioesterase [Alcaligenaceae bacterium B3P038]
MTDTSPSPSPTLYFGWDIPFMAYVGLVPISLDENGMRGRLLFKPELTNNRGDVHGGTLMSVLDFAMGSAARFGNDTGSGVATINMNTDFLSPGTGDLSIEGRCTRRGRSIAFCEGIIYDSQGQIVARATAAFKILQRRPGGD